MERKWMSFGKQKSGKEEQDDHSVSIDGALRAAAPFLSPLYVVTLCLPSVFIYLFPISFYLFIFSPSVLLGSFFLPFLAFPVSLSATRRTRKIVTIHFRHQSELTSLSELQRLCPQFNDEWRFPSSTGRNTERERDKKKEISFFILYFHLEFTRSWRKLFKYC